MGNIDVEVVRRLARLLAEQEAASGMRLEIASVQLAEDGGEPVVTFRPWGTTRSAQTPQRDGTQHAFRYDVS